jgi:hypothetical protein
MRRTIQNIQKLFPLEVNDSKTNEDKFAITFVEHAKEENNLLLNKLNTNSCCSHYFDCHLRQSRRGGGGGGGMFRNRQTNGSDVVSGVINHAGFYPPRIVVEFL